MPIVLKTDKKTENLKIKHLWNFTHCKYILVNTGKDSIPVPTSAFIETEQITGALILSCAVTD